MNSVFIEHSSDLTFLKNYELKLFVYLSLSLYSILFIFSLPVLYLLCASLLEQKDNEPVHHAKGNGNQLLNKLHILSCSNFSISVVLALLTWHSAIQVHRLVSQ